MKYFYEMEDMKMIIKKHKLELIIIIVFLALLNQMNRKYLKQVWYTKIKELIALINNAHYKKSSDQEIRNGSSF